jgi:hypothetical protein
MKFTQLKNEKTYRRKSDGKVFTVKNDHYYVANDQGVWEKTEDLNLKDDFEPCGAPDVSSYVIMYNKYKSGTIEEQQKYLDKIIRASAHALDALKNKGILDGDDHV